MLLERTPIVGGNIELNITLAAIEACTIITSKHSNSSLLHSAAGKLKRRFIWRAMIRIKPLKSIFDGL
jgi:hypothetical protein